MEDQALLSGREQMRQWVARWKLVSPILEAERMARLAQITDDQARATANTLLAMWRPALIDSLGAELVDQQRVFMKAARAARGQ